MAADIRQLNIATYKGFKFACNDVSTTVGRAQIKHRFVNSDSNSIEDVGKEPRIYSLVAVITGENYLTQKDELLALIEKGGKGVLIHPFFGRIENAVVRPVTFEETIKDFGRTLIPLTFDIDGTEGIPVRTETNLSIIRIKKENAHSAIEKDIAKNFKVNTDAQSSFEKAKQKIQDFRDTLTAASAKVDAVTEKINSFTFNVEKFSKRINFLILNPENLAPEMMQLIDSLSNLYDSGEKALEVVQEFFRFGQEDEIFLENTTSRVEINRNNTILNSAIVAGNLVSGYESASDIEYETIEQIDDAILVLDEGFDSDFTELGIDTQALIIELRTEARDFLEQQKISVRKTIIQNITIATPARIIAYENYGSSELGQRIARLNKEINVSFMSGDVMVFENDQG